ncbi:MAG: HAMP domain-containing protein [Armatimonadetes bacterium]|nr:HAMP domain-containing protein [Armatimonadota bacterium]
MINTVTVDAEPLRVATVGIRASGANAPQAEPLFVQVAFRLTDIERGLDALDNALITLLPLSLLVAGASGAIITGRALRPVRDITIATDTVAAESLAGRLPVTGSDEFGELSRRFNRMLDRLETSFDKQRRFVADASHELRTPLAIVTAHTSLALDDEAPATPEAARKALTAIHGAAGRMNRIVGDLLLLAQNDGGNLPREHKSVEVVPLLRGAASDAETAYRERTGDAGATIGVTGADTLRLADGDAHLLRRVFINLLENALRYTPPSGKITVTTETHGGMATVTVSDTGCGIAPEHLPHLFDRFYRADAGRDRERGGTGLGLSLVQMLVGAHGGAVSIESEPGRGTTVRVTLPI